MDNKAGVHVKKYMILLAAMVFGFESRCMEQPEEQRQSEQLISIDTEDNYRFKITEADIAHIGILQPVYETNKEHNTEDNPIHVNVTGHDWVWYVHPFLPMLSNHITEGTYVPSGPAYTDADIKKYIQQQYDDAQLGKLIEIADFLDVSLPLNLAIDVAGERLMANKEQYKNNDNPFNMNYVANTLLLDHLKHKYLYYRIASKKTISTGPLIAIAWSPDSKTIAGLTLPNKSIGLWNIDTGKLVHEFTESPGPAADILLVGKNNKIITLNAHNQIRMWDASKKSLLGSIQLNNVIAFSLTLNQPGTILAVLLQSGGIRLWDITTEHLKELPPIIAPDKKSTSLTFDPHNPAIIAAGLFDGTIEIWNINTHSLIHILQTGSSSPVTPIAFSPDGSTITAMCNRTITVWNSDTYAVIKKTTLGKADNSFYMLSPNNQAIVRTLGSLEADIMEIWNIASDAPFILYDMSTDAFFVYTDLAFSPDGSILAVATRKNKLRLYTFGFENVHSLPAFIEAMINSEKEKTEQPLTIKSPKAEQPQKSILHTIKGWFTNQ